MNHLPLINHSCLIVWSATKISGKGGECVCVCGGGGGVKSLTHKISYSTMVCCVT